MGNPQFQYYEYGGEDVVEKLNREGEENGILNPDLPHCHPNLR